MTDQFDDKEPVIRVKDRRMFNLDGTLRTPDVDEDEPARAAEPEPPEPEPAPEPPRATKPDPAPEPQRAQKPEAPPERPGQPSLFSDFVVNLASQAAMYMGLVNDPLGPPLPTDLGAARQMIDLLGMLQEKTRGNLTNEESVLLERILSDLRMQYVAMAAPRR